MNRSFNAWWILPVFTGLVGIMLAVFLNPAKKITTNEVAPLAGNVVVAEPLLITQVTLPPEPAVIEPVLTATIKNNRVVLSNDNAPEVTASQVIPADKPHNNDSQADFNSSELASKFSQVMQEMANEEQNTPEPTEKLHVQELTQQPQWYQDLVPELEFSSHIYASGKNERWVRVNNQVVQEGELITSTMRLISIEPQQVTIEMHERRFTLPALISW